MFYLNTLSNSFVLGEKDNEGKIIKQLGFPKGGLTYLITNSNNIKFYLKEDYFYKNVVWSADVPLVIDGIPIGIDALPTALKKIFHQEVESGSVDLDFDTESFNAIANAPVSNRFNDIEDSIEAISGEIPTKTSELINDSGFITSQDIPSFSGKLDTSVFEAYSAATATELLNYFDSAEYDSQAKKINFKHGNTIKASIDATAFIKDGMVDDVRIENGNLVIVFNSDSGKEAISIPLTDIFNPNNYYNKQETDALLDDKLDASAYTPSQDVIVDTELSPTSVNPVQNKAIFDKVTLPGSGTIFVEYSTSAESFTVPDINQIKLDVSELSYTSPSIQFTLRSNSGETYDVIGTGTYDFSNNEWVLSNGFGDVTYSIENNIITFISPTHTIGYVWLFGFDKLSTLIPTEGKDWLKDVVSSHTANTEIHVTASEKATWNAKSDFSGDYNDLANKPTIPSKTSDLTNDSDFATTGDVQIATADMATKTWVGNQGYLTEHQSLDNYYTKSETSGATQISTALNGKADTATTYTKTEVDTALAAKANTATTYTKSEVDAALGGKQATLQSGTNIKTINNESILGSGNITIEGGNKVVELTQAQYDALVEKDDTFYIVTDAEVMDINNYYTKTESDDLLDTKLDASAYTPTDLSNYYTKSETSGATQISTALNGKADTATTYTKTETDTLLDAKQATLQSGTNIKTINNESILGSGNIDIQGGGGITSGEVQTMIDNSLSGYVTTNTKQEITGSKTFSSIGNIDKPIIFKQVNDSNKIGFVCRNSASTNNELATFEFRPNTFTIDNVQHPLLYFGHYRNVNTANAGVPQTVIGFRQYDQKNAAAYHYLIPLPEKAKTPFSLTTSFKDYYAPMGFKVDSGGTMVTTDNTGVVDLSSYLGGGGSSYSAGTGIDITNDVISVSGVSHNSLADGTKMLLKGNVTSVGQDYSTIGFDYYYGTSSNKNSITIKPLTINGYSALRTQELSISVVETSAITTAITSSSTDAQVPSAKAVNDKLGGLSLVKLTQAEYSAMEQAGTLDNSTLYVIIN